MTEHSHFIAKNNRTLGDAVTNQLREAIISGRLAPGTPLVQEKLANEFGVSRVPVREALRILASENLVHLESHRGAIVADLSLSELDELYTIIWSVEFAVARKVIPIIDDGTLARLRSIVDSMLVVRRDPLAWYKLNVELHRTFMSVSGWSIAVRIADECRRNISRYALAPDLFSDNVDLWTRRNTNFVEACEKRDLDAVLVALGDMQDHTTPAIREHFANRLASTEGGSR